MMKDTFTLKELATGVLGIKLSDPDSWDTSYTYSYCYNEAIREGKSEEEAEEYASECSGAELDEEFDKYVSAIESTVETYFEYVGLEVVRLEHADWGFGGKYKLKPSKDWKEVANLIREIINGVGYFYFAGLKSFLDSGPYTAREAALSHLGYVSDYGEVYGEPSPSRLLERSLR